MGFLAQQLALSPSRAAEYPHGPVEPASISMSKPDDIGMVVTPIIGGESITIGSNSTSVTTNNITGYSLTMSTGDATNNKLNHTSIDGQAILPLASNDSLLSSGTWGYTVNDPTDSPSNSNFNIVPNMTNPVAIKTESQPISADETKVFYGAKVSYDNVAGTYNNTVVYTAMTNAVNAPTVSSIIPNSGALKGGMEVTITGSEFDSIVNIAIGGMDCADILITSATTATCKTPARFDAGAKDVVVTTQGGTATLAQGFYYEPDTFKFTIDTRMTDTLDTDAGHFSGTATSFSIPLSGNVGWNSSAGYNWQVNCDNTNPSSNFVNYSGAGGPSSTGVACNYSRAGEYQIAIRHNGDAYYGWMDAFGFNTNTDGANSQSNKNMFKSIDVPFSRLMRTPGAPGQFWNVFMGVRNAVGIPANLFSELDTSLDYSCEFMFSNTFYQYAVNSTSATIPEGLFDSINLGNAGSFNYTFGSTFNEFAKNSTRATIPEGLFDSLNMTTRNTTSMENAFAWTFASYGNKSLVGTIPSGLFSSVDTTGATNFAGMFSGTFNNYTSSSLVGTIPAGLFDTIVTSSATEMPAMFQYTFDRYAYESKNATIPNNLFNFFDTSKASNVWGVLGFTFNNYGVSSNSSTNINNIWGNANLSAINAGNADNALQYTFANISSLGGPALSFINNKLGFTAPNSYAGTFISTGVSDLAQLHANWK